MIPGRYQPRVPFLGEICRRDFNRVDEADGMDTVFASTTLETYGLRYFISSALLHSIFSCWPWRRAFATEPKENH